MKSLFIIQNFLRFFVSKSLIGLDKRLAEPAVLNFGVLIKHENGRKGVFGLFRIERTKVV